MRNRWRNIHRSRNNRFHDIHFNGDIQKIRAWKIELGRSDTPKKTAVLNLENSEGTYINKFG